MGGLGGPCVCKAVSYTWTCVDILTTATFGKNRREGIFMLENRCCLLGFACQWAILCSPSTYCWWCTGNSSSQPTIFSSSFGEKISSLLANSNGSHFPTHFVLYLFSFCFSTSSGKTTHSHQTVWLMKWIHHCDWTINFHFHRFVWTAPGWWRMWPQRWEPAYTHLKCEVYDSH